MAIAAVACTALDGPPTSTHSPMEQPSASVDPRTATPSLGPTASSGSETVSPTTAPGAARWDLAGEMREGREYPHVVALGDGRALVVGDDTGHSTNAELWDPATNVWRGTQGLNAPRIQFAAVGLADGRALITGGLNQRSVSYSSSYVFDPASETWTKVGLMGTARTGPAIALLSDGRVLVAGGAYYEGFAGTAPGDADGATLASYARGEPATAPSLADVDPSPIGWALATAEIFDPRTGQWSPTGPMTFARIDPHAVTLGDGRVLIWGTGFGERVDERARTMAEIFDPESGRFTIAAALPEIELSPLEALGVPVRDPTTLEPGNWTATPVVALPGGDALITGTNWSWGYPLWVTRAFRFRTATGRWTEVGVPYVERWSEQAEPIETWGDRLPDGFVGVTGGGRVVLGGSWSDDVDEAQKRRAVLFDPDTGTQSALPEMPIGRTRSTAVTLADGTVLIVGDLPPSSLALRFALTPG